jgi:protein TonB
VPRRATPPESAVELSPQRPLPDAASPPSGHSAAAAGKKASKKTGKAGAARNVRTPDAEPAISAASAAASATESATSTVAVAPPPVYIPSAALASSRNDRLVAIAIAASVVIHAIVLLIHFRPFLLKTQNDKGPMLEVALVNAKTAAKPTKADVLAQANLDGGGNTDADRRARSPLPVLPASKPEPKVALAARKVETLEHNVREVLTQLRAAPVTPPTPPTAKAQEPVDLPSSSELMQKTLEAMRLEAQVAKDMEAYQKRPKRRFVGARAEEYRFARYVEDWRLKIERIGNLNYPEAARRQKLYGNLLLNVSIRADGSLENVEIVRSSGNRILDASAVHIVEMSAPFAAFPPDIKRDTDILSITRTWTFTKADALESR